MWQFLLKFFRGEGLFLVVLLGAVTALGYTYAQRYIPCETPVSYRLGNFDTRFDIRKEDFLEHINEAAGLWNDELGKEIFVYAADGEIPIHAIYDSRQKTVEITNELDESIEEKKARATRIANEYAALEATVKRGDVRLREVIDELNRLAETYNNLQLSINADIGAYNRALPEGEIKEARYISDEEGERIEIFEYKNKTALTRILAHELGHALGLEHVDSEDSIMYPLNESDSLRLSAEDRAELERICTGV